MRELSKNRQEPNPAVAVDGGIRRPFHIGRSWPAATEPQRWATKYTALIYKNTERRRLFSDMKHIIKPFVTLLAISLLASACSHKTESSVPTNSTNKPQFTIAAADLAVPAELGTNGVGSGHETIVIHLQFSAAKADEFRKFTREHAKQQTQLLVGSKVVAEPYINAEISGGKADIAFSSIDQAQPVADSLNK